MVVLILQAPAIALSSEEEVKRPFWWPAQQNSSWLAEDTGRTLEKQSMSCSWLSSPLCRVTWLTLRATFSDTVRSKWFSLIGHGSAFIQSSVNMFCTDHGLIYKINPHFADSFCPTWNYLIEHSSQTLILWTWSHIFSGFFFDIYLNDGLNLKMSSWLLEGGYSNCWYLTEWLLMKGQNNLQAFA